FPVDEGRLRGDAVEDSLEEHRVGPLGGDGWDNPFWTGGRTRCTWAANRKPIRRSGRQNREEGRKRGSGGGTWGRWVLPRGSPRRQNLPTNSAEDPKFMNVTRRARGAFPAGRRTQRVSETLRSCGRSGRLGCGCRGPRVAPWAWFLRPCRPPHTGS